MFRTFSMGYTLWYNFVMKKITLISLIGPVLFIILRIVEVVERVKVLGLGNNYYCDLSTDAKCSLLHYIFKSDYAVLSYISIVSSFIFLFIITSYIFFLIKLYKENKIKLFWVLILFTILFLVSFPFIINYIQYIA